MKIGLPVSLNLLFWSFISLLRAIVEHIHPPKLKLSSRHLKKLRQTVAVCIPAHNEEKKIGNAISSVITQLPPQQIFVVSDGSTDRTAAISLESGCHVLEISSGLGKARALKRLIRKFDLIDKYSYLLFVDADTQLHPQYLTQALSVFDSQPEVAALAAYATPLWENPEVISRKNFIAAYRTKLYAILQFFFMYGQTWKYTNINPVVPGFAAMYPTKVLKRLELATSGILIEDFNLAFQIHHKNLGWIAHFPQISAAYHDPINLTDYARQVSRWNIGFYQTVRHHGIWLSLFWLSTMFFSTEILLISFFNLLVPVVLTVWVIVASIPQYIPTAWIMTLTVLSVFYAKVWLSILTIDYVLTIYIAAVKKRPLLLLYGLGFFIFSFINSWVLVASVWPGLTGRSSGRWTPAKR